MSPYFTQPELRRLLFTYREHSNSTLSLSDFVAHEHRPIPWSRLRSKYHHSPAALPLVPELEDLKVLSLNCGGFGIDSNQFRVDKEYQETCFAKLVDHIRTHRFALVHLQDYPYTPEYLERLSEATGYALRAVPQIFLTHARPDSQDSGLVVLAHPSLHLSDWSYRHHETNIPKVHAYQPNLDDAEMLFLNGTLSYTLEFARTAYRLANTYICPVSTARRRRAVFAAEARQARDYPHYLLTGDTNIYGTNTLVRVGGLLPANPYAFALNAASALLFGRNYPHLLERRRLARTLHRQGLRLANNAKQSSISFALQEFVPEALRFLVAGRRVGWLLDLAVTNLDSLECRLNAAPYGDIDHASLHINLPKFDKVRQETYS